MLNDTRWLSRMTDVARLHRDLDSIFGKVFGDTTYRPGSAGPYVPVADVWHAGDKWLLSMALPGISPDKVEIDIAGRTLRVRGERTPDARSEWEPVMSEISYGRFEREFTLPENIDARHVEATYRNGMLELSLPLSEAAKPRRIEVKTAPEDVKDVEDVKQLQAA